MAPIETSLSAIDLQSVIIPNPLIVNADLMVINALSQMADVWASHNSEREEELLESIYREARASCIWVIESEKIIGIITEQDVVRLSTQRRSLECLTVREVMTSPVLTLQAEDFTDLLAVTSLLRRNHIRHLPVVDRSD
ncbi:MAG: CBS domain-containing protein, partial [Pseudanabaena sp.]